MCTPLKQNHLILHYQNTEDPRAWNMVLFLTKACILKNAASSIWKVYHLKRCALLDSDFVVAVLSFLLQQYDLHADFIISSGI